MNSPLVAFPKARILIRGVNWLGDAVMTTPALQRLREALPQAHLAVLTVPKLAPLYDHHPAINQILSADRSLGAIAIARLLREQRFDYALILPNSFRSAWETFLARVPQRIGYAANARSCLLTRSIPRPVAFRPMRKRTPREVHKLIQGHSYPATPWPPEAHHIHHYLRLAAELGALAEPCPPRLAVTQQELDEFTARFEIPTSQPLLGLCPGAEYGPAKCWPLERFAAAAAEIQRATGCRWIIFGTETGLGKLLAARLPQPSHDLTGRTTLRQLLAGLKLCGLVLSNDSGPMHAAAALGTPVVVPFGSTSPELTGPGLPGSIGHVILNANVPCAPCFQRVCPIDHRCMNNISVEAVVRAVLDRLKQ